MKFSGHETFPVREGWLHKGMKLTSEAPELFASEDIADHLGVGRNMAKSIRHWLVVTGLATDGSRRKKGESQGIQLTELGQLVWDHDPHMTNSGTWWILHANLVNNLQSATTWSWFFNNFNHDRFDRGVCLESLRRFIEASQKRVPSIPTLTRDLGCLLLSYSRTVPSVSDDPEDGADCPFRELELLRYFRTSGHYRVNRAPKRIPAFVFCYVMSLCFSASHGVQSGIKLSDVARQAGGPGKVFCLNAEALFETVSEMEANPGSPVGISGLAGERTIKIEQMSPIEWAALFLENIQEASHV